MDCNTQSMKQAASTTFQERLSHLLDVYGLEELQRNAAVLAPVAEREVKHHSVRMHARRRSDRMQHWNANQLAFTFDCR